MAQRNDLYDGREHTMRNILILALASILLFSLSAALSLYLNWPGKQASTDGSHAGNGKGKGKDTKDGEPDTSLAPIVGQPTPKAAEEAAQLLARLRQRSADLEKREDEARRQEQRMQIVMDDIKGERGVIDSLRAELSEELKKLKEKQEGITRKARGLEEQKEAAKRLLADLEKRQIVLEKNEDKNFDRMATISDSMPAEKAARLLKQMADSGQMETAVKVLGQMRERRAAAVLAEITDVALSAQLMEKLRGLKRPAPATAGAGPP
jgi:flagellar motility protein MotE (MotC chaperone)